MGEQQQGNRSDTDSLSPVVLKQSTYKEYAAGTKRGKVQSILFILVMIVAVLEGSSFLAQNTSTKAELFKTGKSINRLKESYFDRFWGCALKGENILDIRSNWDLISSIQRRADAEPVAYGSTVKEKCITYLEDLLVKLDRIHTPIQFQKPITQIVNSTRQLNVAWQGYIEYLIDPKMKYEHQRGGVILNKIAVNSYKFINAHNRINRFLLEKL